MISSGRSEHAQIYSVSHETHLITWINDIVEEGRTSGDQDLCSGPASPSDCAHLAFATVKLWAWLIRGNQQWAILGVIGESLEIYADFVGDVGV